MNPDLDKLLRDAKPATHHVADGRLGRCMNDHAKPAEAAAVDPGQGSLFETSVFRYE